jgi:hypothetical protein
MYCSKVVQNKANAPKQGFDLGRISRLPHDGAKV